MRKNQILKKLLEAPSEFECNCRKNILMRKLLLIIGLLMFVSLQTYAGTTGSLPWDSALNTFSKDISGPVAYFLAIIAVAGFFVMMYFGEHGSMMKKAGSLVFCLGGGLLATKLITTLYTSVNGGIIR